MKATRRAAWTAVLLGPMAGMAGTAHAGITRYCEQPAEQSAAEKDRLLRFAAVIKDALDRSGARVALVSRSGLDLSRFGLRYSHAGLSLRASPETPWSVRQLYFACDEKVPRLYDQGMAGFLLGSHEASIGYVSALLLPADAADAATALEQAALDKRQALAVLAPVYSANAYPFSLRYQNCNQWVAELMASAWDARDPSDVDGRDDDPAPRARAQRWLLDSGYVPSVIALGWRPLMWASLAIPWVHDDDHPPADLDRNLYRVSMPAAIEAFVQGRWPAATRLEFCHNERQVVVHRGFSPLAEGCEAGVDDTVIPFE